ncbi:Mechanosensitive ion channel [Prevotella sp. tc2-28]|uniref:mechanosensitive ion channel family protein n=1 Tax=Prevotella sp. tc2-28 TaxID=1761888 RepID=UPI00089975A4|nr:mechanosensitive ion channel domain-containing protein [Prevotella sp. tc2-28]SEA17279.1 Mechanosensitive ion channel [Prevotella sp. tc2-28]
MRRLLTIIVILATTLSTHAVLKEKDLPQTLQILRSELVNYHRELTGMIEQNRKQSESVRNQLIETMLRSNQNSLMLYSQKQEYVFDLTYACNEATDQYHLFQQQQLPFKAYLNKTNNDIARYDSLIGSLKAMPVTMLSNQAQTDRNICLTLATNIRNSLDENRITMQDYIRYYDMTENRLSHLNDYAQKRYNDIQTSIFRNGGDSYPNILKNWPAQWQNMLTTVHKKYRPNENSQWDSRWIFGLLISTILYAVIASLMNLVAIRYIVPKRLRTVEFMKKRACITMATTTITFALILGLTMAITKQNFIVMASNLLVEFAWLLGVILISLLLRVNGNQIKSAFHIYTPLLVVCFIVIAFRIILIPSELVNMLFPPVLLVCAFWQWRVIKRHNKNVPRSDMFYTYFSLLVFIISVVCSWSGYTLMSVQILIWWMMQLTCILTITCVTQYIKLYGIKHHFAERPITQTWAYDLAGQVLLPILGVCSVMISIWWAADVFNLSDLCWRIFKTNFVDLSNLKISILSLSMVINLWFLFAYINRTLLKLMRMHYEIKDASTAASREVMGKNVVQVIVWGAWFMMTMTIMGISMEWLLVVTGGLSTGIGFASKDIIENIYYGISLMTGRIKVGDMIQVDGTMGKVTSINYTSTVVESVYGEVITFQNSQLFSKNYKNLTRNHGYVLQVIPYGVAYGSNLQQVMTLVDDAVNNMRHQWMDRSKKAKSVIGELGDSSINFKIFVWADAVKKSYVISDVLRTIYDTLNQNGIEIPFPQQDVHIKNE